MMLLSPTLQYRCTGRMACSPCVTGVTVVFFYLSLLPLCVGWVVVSVELLVDVVVVLHQMTG